MSKLAVMTIPSPDAFSASDLRFNPPSFKSAGLIDFLQHQYGVEGEFSELDGERDQNFRITRADEQRFVFKISGIDEDFSLVDFQVRALEHIGSVAPGLPVPRHVANLDGQLVSQLFDANDDTYNVRLLTFLDGSPMVELGAPTLATIRSLGRIQARLCLALRDFSHAAATHFMPWDAMNGLVVSKLLCRDYLTPALIKSCAPTLEHLQQVALPALLQMPSQVIHNDVNMGNALVDAARPAEITGIIDFGDMVQRPLVIDLASSLTMLLESTPDVLPAAASLVSGFDEFYPLPGDQRELLYDAVCARAILSVQLVRFYRDNVLTVEKYSEDDYDRTVAGLRRILATDSRDFSAAIHQAG